MKLKRRQVSLFALACLAGLTFYAFKIKNAENPKTDKLKLQPGFKAEHIYSPSEHDLGSWVSMCFDDKGRMIASDQYGGLYRLTIPAIGSSDLTPEIEKIELPGTQGTIGTAHGLLYAFNSLFVMVNNRSTESLPQHSGFYQLKDTDGDDKYDQLKLLKQLKGNGEHGPHSIKLSPDGKSLYVIAGNYTDLPEQNAYRLPPTWAYDNLFPEIKDPRGHANDRMQPGGWVAKVDPATNEWELISAGYRNPFDLAFNDIGDLFVYDADMEWDFGLPWYRPTRICHATSGSEFGWRTGDGKWSPDFTDNLPAVINIGQGSPTNLLYLKEAKFPAKYKQSLLAFDWSFGIMHAIHLFPEGSSYSAKREEFLSGVPLPLTDGAIGPDGALYFLTGGRRLSSDLYRVYYEGPGVSEVETTVLTADNKLRREIEGYHMPKEGAVEAVWSYLNYQDKHVRYASRIALEHQPLQMWKAKALSEKNPVMKTQALLGLIRSTKDNTTLHSALAALNMVQTEGLGDQFVLDYLRTYEVLFSRISGLTEEEKKTLTKKLSPMFPAGKDLLDKELVKLLVFLDDPTVVAKTIKLIESSHKDVQAGGQTATSSADLILRNPQYGLDIAKMLEKVPPVNATYYAVALSEAKAGWTPALRDKYFKWYKKAFEYRGGNSYVGFIDKARKMALENVPENKREHYDQVSGGDMLTDSGNDLKMDEYPEGPGRNWQLDEASKALEAPLVNRDFYKGKNMFVATTCNRCHSMNGQGGNVGPDLTRIGTRFSKTDILEAILEPSNTVSDQYAATEFQLKSGESIIAKIISEKEDSYVVSQNPYAPDYLMEIKKNTVVSKKYSDVSVMLPGLVNSLNEEELKDLLAYLIAGGDENNKMFK
ncbi:MAG: c-type cytochrome [Cytophagales bacterium]|nr:c-type cytochrome [Cytophagales bacterium]